LEVVEQVHLQTLKVHQEINQFFLVLHQQVEAVEVLFHQPQVQLILERPVDQAEALEELVVQLQEVQETLLQ
jgi:hypothetical protein